MDELEKDLPDDEKFDTEKEVVGIEKMLEEEN
jgi:hypothetical protein